MATNTQLTNSKKFRSYTHVDLKTLPDDGETYQFDRNSGELNPILTDLLSPNQDYQVDLELRPAGNAFEISGKIVTSLNLSCARCGRDMDFPVNDEFHELIVVNPERPPAGHSGHTGNFGDGPFCNYLTHYNMDLGEFVHEHIAAAEPFTPHCQRSDCEDYLSRLKDEEATTLSPDKNPFAALKNLKVTGQRD